MGLAGVFVKPEVTLSYHQPSFVLPQHQMDPSSNFSNYRTALRGATQRSETAHSSQEKVGERGGERLLEAPFSTSRRDLSFLPSRS